jgi:hypothetical protein
MELQRVNEIESYLLDQPQADCPVTHAFSPGVYLRTVRMPAGSLVVGHLHKTRFMNVLLRGRLSVFIDGQIHELTAPQVIESDAGGRKIAFIHEDVDWLTIHPTTETDIAVLEETLVEKSPAFLAASVREADLNKHLNEAARTLIS